MGGLGAVLGRLEEVLGRSGALLGPSGANMWNFSGFTGVWDPQDGSHPRGGRAPAPVLGARGGGLQGGEQQPETSY